MDIANSIVFIGDSEDAEDTYPLITDRHHMAVCLQPPCVNQEHRQIKKMSLGLLRMSL